MSDVAAAAGVSERVYRDIERGFVSDREGNRKPVNATVKQYEAVAHALALEPTLLFDQLGVDYAPTQPEEPPVKSATASFSTLADRLRHQRATVLQHASLRDVASGHGLSHSTLAKYEHGEFVPQGRNVVKVAEAYEIPVEEVRALLDIEAAQRVSLTLPERHARLSPAARRALIEHADYLLRLQDEAEGRNPA